MITATRILLAGTWSGTPADVLHLERDDRHRRRMVMRCVGKTAFLLNLPEAKVLKHGDALELEDGRLIVIESAPEALLDITATDPAHLVRIAWHLGNRHLPTQLLGDRLRIREDHVIEDMLVKLGATVAHVSAAFDPEGGAYGHGTVQGHDHHDHHDHHGHDHHSHDHHDHAHHGHDHRSHDHAHHAHDHSGHAHDADGNCIHDHHAHSHHDHAHHDHDHSHDHGHAHRHDHHHGHGHHDHAHDADGNCLPGHDHKHG